MVFTVETSEGLHPEIMIIIYQIIIYIQSTTS